MTHLFDFIYFFGQTFLVVLAILLTLLGIVAILGRNKGQSKEGKLVIKPLNKKYRRVTETVQSAMLTKHELKKLEKQNKKIAKSEKKNPSKKRLFVTDFHGDMRASQVDSFAQVVNAILLTHQENDEVLVRIDSPGGVVNGYGLAASHLARLKDAGIKLTVAVDKVAASGGYMMACVANEILAAPFAIIGSVGVVAQLPNFHRFLKKHNIDFEQITAGEYKRTLSLFGETTEKGVEKVQQEVDDTQVLFKEFIAENRSIVEINQIATGEHWFGKKALELKLVDKLETSEQFLLEARANFDLFYLEHKVKKPLSKKFSLAMENLLGR